MDNLTHTLTAIAISQTGLNRKTRFATLTVILAANAPDLDIVAGLKDGATYLKYHRGITHSFIGIIAIAVILWGVMSWIGKRVRSKPGLPLDDRWLLLAAFLGTGSHLLLDFTNAYGVRPFLPFSGHWYAWDIMFIFDPLLIAILGLGLAVPWLLRLISEEVGAIKPTLVRGAVFGLAAMVVLWGVRDLSHRRALSILDSRTYSEQNPLRLGAFPTLGNPFAWTGVVETDAAFQLVRVNALNSDSTLETIGSFTKPEASPALDAALQTNTGRIFMDFARFPWGHVEETEQGFRVTVCDLRFYNSSARARSFVAVIELDKNLRTRSESFHFTAPMVVGED
jgi:inner membrane protein